MVSAIRHIEVALGDGIKVPTKSEIPNITVARKSIVSTRALTAGHSLALSDLTIKRPGNGIAPKLLPALIGRTLSKDVDKDETIQWDSLA
jgi:N,N'-diacetyllegionaminate synthase